MNLLPRKLYGNETPGPHWLNQLLEYVESITPRGSATVRTEEIGTGTILHATPSAAPSAPSALPPITNEHQEHMVLVLELDEEKVTELELTEENKWQALYPTWGYRKLQ